jgi:hypothetical protein
VRIEQEHLTESQMVQTGRMTAEADSGLDSQQTESRQDTHGWAVVRIEQEHLTELQMVQTGRMTAEADG